MDLEFFHRLGVRKIDFAGRMDRGRKSGGDPVIVFLRQRIELVVVAADAGHREPEKTAPDRRDHVVELIIADLLHRLRRDLSRIRPRDEESRGTSSGILAGHQFVAGELHADEFIVGHVVIERLDDPVAVVVGPGAEAVELVAAALRVAHHIEPVPSPSLAVALAPEETVDQFRVGIRRSVFQKSLTLRRGRREAGQGKGGPPQ